MSSVAYHIHRLTVNRFGPAPALPAEPRFKDESEVVLALESAASLYQHKKEFLYLATEAWDAAHDRSGEITTRGKARRVKDSFMAIWGEVLLTPKHRRFWRAYFAGRRRCFDGLNMNPTRLAKVVKEKTGVSKRTSEQHVKLWIQIVFPYPKSSYLSCLNSDSPPRPDEWLRVYFETISKHPIVLPINVPTAAFDKRRRSRYSDEPWYRERHTYGPTWDDEFEGMKTRAAKIESLEDLTRWLAPFGADLGLKPTNDLTGLLAGIGATLDLRTTKSIKNLLVELGVPRPTVDSLMRIHKRKLRHLRKFLLSAR